MHSRTPSALSLADATLPTSCGFRNPDFVYVTPVLTADYIGQSSSTLEGEWLFKATLVLLTTKIVEIAREASGQLMELVVPLIEESLRMPAKAVFEEDGIALSV